MIEKFNFFDIYGYLLPGVLLLALLWLPFGLLFGHWPPTDLGSAAIGLVAAYVAGHVLHAIAQTAFEFTLPYEEVTCQRPVMQGQRAKVTRKKHRRYPSDRLLDGDKVLGNKLGGLKRLAEQIEGQFHVKVQPKVKWTEDIGNVRNGAFFACRGYLVSQKASAYAEQQQGMYELTRGAGAAFGLAFFLYVGFGLGMVVHDVAPGLITQWMLVMLALLALLVVEGILTWRPNSACRKAMYWLFAGVLFFAGVAGGQNVETGAPSGLASFDHFEAVLRAETDPKKFGDAESAYIHVRQAAWIHDNEKLVIFALAGAVAALSLVCLSAFRVFAVGFAAHVYRDYTVIAPAPAAPPPAAPDWTHA